MSIPEIVVSAPEDEPIEMEQNKHEQVQNKQYLQAPSAGNNRSIRTHQDEIKEAGTKETYDDEPDETLVERIWGLTEMFPEPVRNFCGTVADYTVTGIKTCYQFSCNTSWIFFTSSMILFAPVIFETERAQMEEMQRTQQKQVLLGPGSAISPSGGSPALPPMAR